MQSSESHENIYKALIKAQSEFTAIPFDAKNPHFKNKYATLTATQEHVRGILAKHGLGLIQSVESLENQYLVESRIIHESGEWIKSEIRLMVDRQNMQGLGSATTYAKRYAAQALLGLSGDEDDDGNAASKDYQQKNIAPSQKQYEKVEPKDYVMTMGSPDVKGKKLGSLSYEKLTAISEYLSDQIKNGKGSDKQKKFYGFVISQVRKVIEEKAPPQDETPDYDESDMPPEPESLGMDDFGPPPEAQRGYVLDRLKNKWIGE